MHHDVNMLARIISDCGWVTYDTEQWRTLLASPVLRAEACASENKRWLKLLDKFHYSMNYDNCAFTGARYNTHNDFSRLRDWFRGRHDRDWLGVIPRDIVLMISEYMWYYARREYYGGTGCRTYFLGNYDVHGDRPSDVFVCGENYVFNWASGDRPRIYQVKNGVYSVIDNRVGITHDSADVRAECLRLIAAYGRV